MVPVFIFARGGSKRLPQKNLRKLGGIPLLAWSIRMAKSINQVERVIVSTDSEEIAKTARLYGAETPFLRPKYLARDNTPEWMVWRHALQTLKKLENYKPKFFMSLPTTAPLRSKSDVEACLKMFEEKKPDGVIGITPSHWNPSFNMVYKKTSHRISLVENSKSFYRMQDTQTTFNITTTAYVLSSDFILRKNHLFDGKIYGVIIPKERSIDIDDEFDLKIAKIIYENCYK